MILSLFHFTLFIPFYLLFCKDPERVDTRRAFAYVLFRKRYETFSFPLLLHYTNGGSLLNQNTEQSTFLSCCCSIISAFNQQLVLFFPLECIRAEGSWEKNSPTKPAHSCSFLHNSVCFVHHTSKATLFSWMSSSIGQTLSYFLAATFLCAACLFIYVYWSLSIFIL